MLERTAAIAGKIIGTVSGGAAALAWSYAMWVPAAGLASSGVGFLGALLMTLLALFGAIAAVRGHAAVLLVVFLASFFPVGFAFLTADGWLRLLGFLDFGFLAAAVLLWVARERPGRGSERDAAVATFAAGDSGSTGHGGAAGDGGAGDGGAG